MVDTAIQHVTAALRATADGEAAWLSRYDVRAERTGTQFLVMLKPEVVTPVGPDAGPALRRVAEVLAGHGVSVGAGRLLTSAYVEQSGLVRGHYPTLNAITRLGPAGMSEAARDRLHEVFPDLAGGGRRVVGAFDLLESSELTAFALEVLSRNLPVHKVGTGAYAMPLRLDGEDLVVLNPFHPQQLAHFTAPGGAIVLLECWCERPLPELRRSVIGAIDPREAEPGSVRRVLLDEQAELGLGAISTRRNGAHMSPGLPESMASMTRYFSDVDAPVTPMDTAFGRRLAAAGVAPEVIDWVSGDPYVDLPTRRGSLFELSEDLDQQDAVRLVREVAPRPTAMAA